MTHPPASFLEGPVQSLIIIHVGASVKSTPKSTPKLLYVKILLLLLILISYIITYNISHNPLPDGIGVVVFFR